MIYINKIHNYWYHFFLFSSIAYADYYVVAARTGGEGMGGISLLLVERTLPGVNARAMECQGMFGSGTSYITFEDVSW